MTEIRVRHLTVEDDTLTPEGLLNEARDVLIAAELITEPHLEYGVVATVVGTLKDLSAILATYPGSIGDVAKAAMLLADDPVGNRFVAQSWAGIARQAAQQRNEAEVSAYLRSVQGQHGRKPSWR